jgi:hypothetical protein
MSADVHVLVTCELIVPVGAFGEDADIAWLLKAARTSASEAFEKIVVAVREQPFTKNYQLRLKGIGEPIINLRKLDDEARKAEVNQ